MLGHRPIPRNVSRSVLLVVTILILLGSLRSTEALVYYSLCKESQTTVSSPPVILQNGTAGTSTIYTNSTSAKVSVVAPIAPPVPIFEDGFEDGTFDAWTGSSGTGTSEVIGAAAYQGNYGAHFTVTDSNYQVRYKTHSTTYTTLFMRAYVKFVAFPGFDNRYVFPIQQVADGLQDDVTSIGVKRESSTSYKWAMQYLTGGTTEAIATIDSPTPETGVWYCLEIETVVSSTDGESRAWIDGAERFIQTGLNNIGKGNLQINKIGCGRSNSYYGGGGSEVYVDCVVVADTYIGPEAYVFVDNNTSDVDSSEDKGTHSNFARQKAGPDSYYDVLEEENTGDKEDYVDLISDVDSSPDKGTHSNFTAQHFGPDSTYDTLTEENTSSATFGKTDVGVSSFGYTNYLEASRYPCLNSGTLTKITLYLTSGASGRYARVAIYSDDNGAPDSLLGESSEMEITEDGWHDFTGFDVSVSANTYYWSAFQINSSTLKWYYDTGETNQHAYRSYTYGAFPASFGSPSYTADEQSIYATYTPAATFGKTDIGGTGGQVDWNSKAGCRFQAPENGNITEISVYCWGSVGEDPTIYLAVYSDDNGSPNTLLGYGFTTRPTSVSWVSVTGLDIPITANAYYWLALQSGDATIYFYYDGGATNQLMQQLEGADIPPPDTSFGSGTYYAREMSIYATYMPTSANYELDLEVQWTSLPYSFPNEELCIYANITGSENIKVDLWNTTASIWANILSDLNASSWNNVSITEWLTSSTFTIRFKGGTETGDCTQDSWQIDVCLIHVWTGTVNYEFDLEVQWTGVDYDEANETLCIYGGTMGSEDIRVDVWNGTAWKNLFLDLSSGWNNVSVSSYLTSSNFTIRFKGGKEAGDAAQDSWNIDTTLLHVWTSVETTYDYVLRVKNTVTDSWQIRLKKYSDSNINRLQNCTIYFHNSTDGVSGQIQIENGNYTLGGDEGSWYDLHDKETIYIAMTVDANSTGTSYVCTYLEIRIPGTTTYMQYIIAFEIT